MIQKFNEGDKIYSIQEVTKNVGDITFTQYCKNNNISTKKISIEIIESYENYRLTHYKKVVVFHKHQQYTIKNILLDQYIISSNNVNETISEEMLLTNFITEIEFRKLKLQSLSDNNFNSFLKKIKK